MGIRKIGFGILAAFVCLMLCVGLPLPAIHAQEDGSILQGELMMTTVQTEGREKPEAEAAVLVEFAAGSQVMVIGQSDGWYEVFYQGKTVYVEASVLAASDAVDMQALEEEMQKTAEQDTAFIESLEMQRKALSRSRVWQIVIVVLIAAIFAVGVISAVKKTKEAR